MRSYAMPQASAVQLTPLIPGVANSECVPWQQVQGFLDMAESALRAKNAANTVRASASALSVAPYTGYVDS